MLFNSFIFFIFLGIVLPIFYLLPSKRTKNLFLVASSYIFYGFWDWRFCGLLLLSSIIDFLVGQAMYRAGRSPDEVADPYSKTTKKRLLLISLFANLGILAYFKYANFFVDSFASMMSLFGMELDWLHLNIILPVGISFYTFQTLSYTIDIYRGHLKPTRHFIDFMLFVSFFPQLVAGPIERAKALLPQLSAKLSPTKLQIQQGVVLVITGLFRKVMIGDTAGRYVDNIFGNMAYFTSFELIVGLLLFSVQIYADFSGYSHMARGIAKLLGVELMKNFEQPYLSRNITEFWRRWHISLSSWLRDYLYISLGGNRISPRRTYINNFLTMVLGGLWHGASWNFVIWGALHGIYLAIHKYTLKGRRVQAVQIQRWTPRVILDIVVLNILVIFTWLFFRSNSWDATVLFFQGVSQGTIGEYALPLAGVAIAYYALTLLMDMLEYRTGKHTYLLNLKIPGLRYGILCTLFVVSCIYMFQSDPLPFIYFQF